MSQTWLKTKLLLLTLLLAACSTQPRVPMTAAKQTFDAVSQPAADMRQRADAKLGTQWGEGVASNVTQVDLRRVTKEPEAVVSLQYAAKVGQGRALKELSLANGRIGMAVLDSNNRKMTLVQSAAGVALEGKNGERYQLRYQNHSNKTYAILATVDGLDVMNGQPGSFNSGGYVLPPYGSLTIEGFRKSDSEVAAFRFSTVNNAYVANTPAGNVANVGLIGTAVFELYDPKAKRQAVPPSQGSAFPNQPGYAPAPSYRD
ncbi:MAG: hypothetical protein KA214_08950 [Neisseriaceae bacterium]|nr:hypothetical protein [Neisseriaceae bacterium]